jgi:hypothetical protein
MYIVFLSRALTLFVLLRTWHIHSKRQRTSGLKMCTNCNSTCSAEIAYGHPNHRQDQTLTRPSFGGQPNLQIPWTIKQLLTCWVVPESG